MKILSFALLLAISCPITTNAQGEYLIKTQKATTTSPNEESEFIANHFRNYKLNEWTPGMRFMVIPNETDMIISTFCNAETGKDVGNGELKYKIMEYTGSEDTPKGAAHFNFTCDGKNYYHEEGYTKVADFCNKPEAGIATLAYLGDIDTAKELLQGQTLYTRTTDFCLDNENAADGFDPVTIPLNTKVTVTAVGVGTREFPVKIVFKDDKGHEYFQNVAISKTNCGMRDDQFIMTLKKNFFPNSFAFADANKKSSDDLTNRYKGKSVYLIHSTTMNSDNGPIKIGRYKQFIINDIKKKNDSNYNTVTLTDGKGIKYEKDVTFTRTSVIGDINGEHEDHFNDLFGIGNLRKKYPQITEENWEAIAAGQIKIGMTPDECRMAKGNPIRVDRITTKGVEIWFYEKNVLEFKGGKLESLK